MSESVTETCSRDIKILTGSRLSACSLIELLLSNLVYIYRLIIALTCTISAISECISQ